VAALPRMVNPALDATNKDSRCDRGSDGRRRMSEGVEARIE
jgi:hypothetical protein